MTFAPLTHASAAGNGGTPPTTAAIDTTGADFLVSVAVRNATLSAMSDSKGNTWNPLTSSVSGIGGNTTIFWCRPISVGTGHTFTGGDSFSSLAVMAFSGSAISPSDVEAGATGSSTTAAPGTITPSQAGCLVISAIGGYATNDGGAISIDGSFNLIENVNGVSGTNFGCTLSYLIQTSAGAANPTTTLSPDNDWANRIASFKAVAGSHRVLLTVT